MANTGRAGTGKARMPLRELSAASGVPRSSLADYLSGATLMPADVLDAVVLALGATPQEARDWANAWERAAAAHPHRSENGAEHREDGSDRPAAGADRSPRPPGQLPADVTAFTGRQPALKQLDELLEYDSARGADHDSAPAVVLSALAGTAGVGKTALAVHWAHQSRDHFPDGQLYANLRGYDSDEPVPPDAVLERFLRALGADAVPPDVDERGALYRSLLFQRRVLIVLDNVRTAEQVRPLLPGTPGCFVLVTSRDDLSGLVVRNGAHRIVLDRLSDAEATELLSRVLGPHRTLDEPEACAELVRLCAGLPLALRVAAERVARHPDRTPLAEIIGGLAGEDRSLDLLDDTGDPLADVRTVFSWSYHALPDPLRGCSASWACIRARTSTRSVPPTWPASPKARPGTNWRSWPAATSWSGPPATATRCTTCCAPTPPSSPARASRTRSARLP
ncbi:NB-ARC domain-containing protein [Catenulispora yoronensis]